MELDLTGKRVLVTGGTGFIGGRLVERLILEHQAQVCVLVHNFARASRIARFSLEMVGGDVAKFDDVLAATSGCDIVFHCAYGNRGDAKAQRRVNVEGTENVLQAALQAGVSRVVHVSTVSVYGQAADGELSEDHERRYTGDVHGDSKLDGEKLALRYAREEGLSVSVIQPTVVYGPCAPSWTIHPLSQLKSGDMILVNGGSGLCNAVYVDDVVTGLILAAVRESAVGEAFLISGPEPLLWRDFFSAYERMLGVKSTVDMSVEEALAYYKRIQKPRGTVAQILSALRKPKVRKAILRLPAVAAPYRLAWSVLPDALWNALRQRVLSNGSSPGAGDRPTEARAVHPLSPTMIRFLAAKTRVCTDKAERMLGYRASFDLDRGMKLTEAWVKWTNLCPQQ